MILGRRILCIRKIKKGWPRPLFSGDRYIQVNFTGNIGRNLFEKLSGDRNIYGACYIQGCYKHFDSIARTRGNFFWGGVCIALAAAGGGGGGNLGPSFPLGWPINRNKDKENASIILHAPEFSHSLAYGEFIIKQRRFSFLHSWAEILPRISGKSSLWE